MTVDLLPDFLRSYYDVQEWKHACAVLKNDFSDEWQDIMAVLSDFRLRKSYIAVPGGRKSLVSEVLDGAFGGRGWKEKAFESKIVVDGRDLITPTHKIDCYKNRVALEIEWNNKDPFFDRDLNNFRILFDMRAISAGVIVTRCDELQEIFDALGRGSSYGASTTHLGKLLPRIEGGGGGGCPILLFGITKKLYVESE